MSIMLNRCLLPWDTHRDQSWKSVSIIIQRQNPRLGFSSIKQASAATGQLPEGLQGKLLPLPPRLLFNNKPRSQRRKDPLRKTNPDGKRQQDARGSSGKVSRLCPSWLFSGPAVRQSNTEGQQRAKQAVTSINPPLILLFIHPKPPSEVSANCPCT